MACFFIQFCEKGKYMVPVSNRKEYFNIRNSYVNQHADKHKMVQMNYSCLPNQDGTLKGATRMSKSVGMDIDFPKDAPELDALIQQTIEKVLEKKEEVGLLMLERSATKGLHLVFKRRAELSQEENLKWAAEVLGVEYDKGAKDITRVFFTPPAEELPFLSDELFDNEECVPVPSEVKTEAEAKAEVKAEAETEEKAEVKAETEAKAEVKAEVAKRDAGSEATDQETDILRGKEIAFDMVMENEGLTLDTLDTEGSRHSNLLALLSAGLPKLMTQDQLKAILRKKMPSFADSQDCNHLLRDFYQKYGSDTTLMGQKLRDINSKSQKMAQEEMKQTSEQGNTDEPLMKEWTRDWNPPVMPKKLPGIVALTVKNYDPIFHPMLAIAMLPIFSALASHFRAPYLTGKLTGPQLHVAVIGSSGSGKGHCTELFNDLTAHTIQDSDNKEWEKKKANDELRDKMANAKEKPSRYHPKLRIFEQASKTSILELQNNLGKNGMLLGYFSEVDGLSNAAKTAYSDLSVILRKGWDGDIFRQFYMSDSSCNTSTKMNISLLTAGTPKAMLERMFSDANCENGLMQRTISVLVPQTQLTFQPPKLNKLSSEETQQRDALIMSLYQKDLELGDETATLSLPKTCKAIENWFNELEQRYNDGLLSEAEAKLSRRCGEFILRAAIPLVALYGEETKEIVDFAHWVGEVAHYTMCRIFGNRVQKNLNESEELINQRIDGRKTALPILDLMPDVFNVTQFKHTRKQAGQTDNVKSLLSYYVKNGILSKVSRGVYQKVKVQ